MNERWHGEWGVYFWTGSSTVHDYVYSSILSALLPCKSGTNFIYEPFYIRLSVSCD